jgi:RNA polymerase sigma-70 factor, ECF subfamily
LVIRKWSSPHSSWVPGHASSLGPAGIVILAGNRSFEVASGVVTKMPRTDGRLRAAVSAHVALVWRVLRRAGLGPADAEDASQDVFWVLAQRIGGVPEPAQRSFLVSTALRVASDRRQSKWRRSVTGGLDAEARVSDAPLPDEALDRRRAEALLDAALDALEPADRAVFILAELEQMTRSEVAQALEIAEGTVASRLRRAREAFERAVRRLRDRPRNAQ